MALSLNDKKHIRGIIKKYDNNEYNIETIKITFESIKNEIKLNPNYINIKNELFDEFILQYLHKSKNDMFRFNLKKKTKIILDIVNIKPKLQQISIYVYPNNFPYTIIKRTEEIYGPFGTSWVYDQQLDDIIDEVIMERSKKFDFLKNIILPEQRSEEWFKMRNDKITASDIACAIGMNKYEPEYNIILKKTLGAEFNPNKACYHGKKFERPATMIYQYRLNVQVDDFGLLGHKIYSFLGASPDGICNKFKLDGKHLSKYVGRMLEIKCPLSREIKMEGPIKDWICPIYYWIQVQMQLESCDLDECDFWQCNISEYETRDEFIKDTHNFEPFRSLETNFEKGCLIQLLPNHYEIEKINKKKRGH